MKGFFDLHVLFFGWVWPIAFGIVKYSKHLNLGIPKNIIVYVMHVMYT